MLAKLLPQVLARVTPDALKAAGLEPTLVQGYLPAVQQALAQAMIPVLAGALTQEQYGAKISLFAEESSQLIQNLQAQGQQGAVQSVVRPVQQQAPAPDPTAGMRSPMNPFPAQQPRPMPPLHQQAPVSSAPPIPVPQFILNDAPESFTEDGMSG